MRSSPTATARPAALRTSTHILKGCGSAALLLLLSVAGATSAHATATATTSTLKMALSSAPTVAVTTAPFGASVTLTATVAPTAAAGTFNFTVGTTPVTITGCGTATVASGVATCVTTALPLGANSLKAAFTPTNALTYAASSSAASTLTVAAATTATTLKVGLTSAPTSAVTTAPFGASVTLTATVAPAAAGTVNFTAGTTPVTITGCGSATVTSGVATCVTTALPLGANSLKAAFTPTTIADYTVSTSTASTLTVAAATTTTSLTAALSSATSVPVTSVPSATSVTLTAAVSPAAAAGTVTFKVGASTTLCSAVTVSSGTATCVTSALTSVGANSLSAVFAPTTIADDTASTGALTVTVTQPAATTALTVSAGPYYYGSSLTLTASMTPSAATGTVTFKDGSSTIGTGTLSSGTATLSLSTLALGAHTFTAVYGGNGTYATSTSPANSSVSIVATNTQVALTPASSIISPGGTVTLTATVTPAAGSATITSGNVSFYDSATLLQKVAVNGSGVATTALPTTLTAGKHYIIASYGGVYSSGVAEFASTLSRSALVTVITGQTITFTQPSAGTYGTTASLTATATSSLPVTFAASGACTASGTTLSFTGVGVGACTVTAQQTGSATYSAATPVSYNVTVTQASQTISHWYNTSTVYGTPVALSATSTSGTAVTYSVISGPGSITGGNNVTPSGVGTIVVGATVAASADYTAITVPVTKNITVYQTSLVVIASSPTVTFGAAVPTITATYTGFVNGDTSASLTTQPTCATPYTAASHAASAPLTYCYNAVNSKYSITYTSGSVIINKATPTVSAWPTASGITYGAALSTSTLSGGTASVAGTFGWTTGTTVPHVGANQSVTFTPTNSVDYAAVPSNISITVAKAAPTVTWPTASAISSGAALSTSKLSGGSANGTFAWVTPNATITSLGPNLESVLFTPTDGTDYNTATNNNVSVTVNKGTPTITAWPTASAITYGQALSTSTLSGGTVANSVTGTFAWTSPNIVPGYGVAVSENVTFTPTGSYASTLAAVTKAITVAVNKGTPVVSAWPTASAITYGQTLASSSLSFTSGSNGTFAWTSSSTAPNAGSPSESVTFTPNNAANFTTTTHNISVVVNTATPTITWPTASAIAAGSTLSTSTFSGGSATGLASVTVSGTFGWTTGSNVPAVGTTSNSVTFASTDPNYGNVLGSVNVTVNACGLQDITNLSYSTALNVYTGTDATGALSLDAEGINESAVCAINTGASDQWTVTINPTISSGAASTYTPDSNTNGTDAAVLAYGTTTTAGQGATITLTDDGAGDPGFISTASNYSNGVFASMGGTVNATNINISTLGNSAHGLDATKGGTLNLANVTATTNGTNASVLVSGNGANIVTSSGGTYSSNGLGSSSVRVAGTGSSVALSGDTVTAQQSPAVTVDGGNSIMISGGTTLTGAAGDDHGVFLYFNPLKLDATSGTSVFTMTGGSLAYTCDGTVSCPTGSAHLDQNNPATLFGVANTTATISLTDVSVTNTTPTNTNANGTLLTAAALNSGTALHNGGNVTFNAYGETLIGDVIVDAISTANLSLAADDSSVPSTLTGAINAANSGAVTVSLTIDATSSWVVPNGPSYLTSLTNAGSGNITCQNSGLCSVYVAGVLQTGIN